MQSEREKDQRGEDEIAEETTCGKSGQKEKRWVYSTNYRFEILGFS